MASSSQGMNDEFVLRWVVGAHDARFLDRLIQQVGDPAPGCRLQQVNELYEWEKVSDWCREFLRSALDHMLIWSDRVAPLDFPPEQRVGHSFRPAKTLGRAALESAAHAVWDMGARTPRECLKRNAHTHVRTS